MAFPTVLSTGTTNIIVDTNTHVITMPNDLVAGKLLYGVSVKDGVDDATIPPDWTVAKRFQANTADAWIYLLNKTASGVDSLTIVSTAAERSASIFYQISGQHASSVPEITTAVGADATLMDPPSLTPSWGADDTLWMLFAGVNESATSTTIPTNYGSKISLVQTGSGEVQAGACSRQLNASSEDPGTWIWSAVRPWGCATVAFRPATAGAAATRKFQRAQVVGQ